MLLKTAKSVTGILREVLSTNNRSPIISTTTNPTAQFQRFFSVDNSKEELSVEVKNGVRKITFNRPEKKNAVTKHMFKSFISAIIEANEDDETTVVALTGTGDYFTSGMDLSSFVPQKSKTENTAPPPPPKQKSPILIFVKCLIDCKKPLVALVNGPAIGMGVTMLGMFDVVYCSDRATFYTRFTEFGLTAELCSTYVFPRVMGYAKASEMLMCNQKLNAIEAFDYGLVSKIYPHDSFPEESFAKVEEMGKLPLKSLMYSKELIRGPQRELLLEVHKNEQSKFDPDVAREVKRKFAKDRNIK